MAPRSSVQACLDLDNAGGPALMGALHRQEARGDEIFSFEYERVWLDRPDIFSFDPDLALVTGPQYPPAGRASFGIFMDSSPDRWGRLLMQRRESMRARQQGRPPRVLTEWDFLLGVHDETRLGAIRFRAAPGEPFIDSDGTLAAPPIASLAAIQEASLRFEQHLDHEGGPDEDRWLSQLFAPGTSLGGARPKASVRDEAGVLCMAKFPSRKDTRDIGAWELVAHRLALRCGIDVPEARPLRVPGSAHTTFVVKRFDRTGGSGRLAFVSAMTLTQRSDGEPGGSYLELVDLLQSRGAATRADCAQLFRRVVFSIAIHNTDDHLRNHGFIIGPRGLRLSPAYDLNPTIGRRELTLAINEVETTCDVAVAIGACKNYGLTRPEAEAVVQQVRAAIGEWRTHATALGIPRSEQELMAGAFEGHK